MLKCKLEWENYTPNCHLNIAIKIICFTIRLSFLAMMYLSKCQFLIHLSANFQCLICDLCADINQAMIYLFIMAFCFGFTTCRNELVLTAEISSLVVKVSLVMGLTTVGMMVSNLLVSLPGSSNT